MTYEEFCELAEVGEYHTIRYNSSSKKARVDVYMFVKAIDYKNALLMDDKGKFIRLNYDKIVDVV